jgi:inositol-polyphosphate multikinase
VLENLTHHFVQPCVMDVKLGQQFWDEDSSEEKVERMETAARSTTSAATGVRLTGFQVHCAPSSNVAGT